MKPTVYYLPKPRKRGKVNWLFVCLISGSVLIMVAVLTALTVCALAAVNHFFP